MSSPIALIASTCRLLISFEMCLRDVVVFRLEELGLVSGLRRAVWQKYGLRGNAGHLLHKKASVISMPHEQNCPISSAGFAGAICSGEVSEGGGASPSFLADRPEPS